MIKIKLMRDNEVCHLLSKTDFKGFYDFDFDETQEQYEAFYWVLGWNRPAPNKNLIIRKQIVDLANEEAGIKCRANEDYTELIIDGWDNLKSAMDNVKFRMFYICLAPIVIN